MKSIKIGQLKDGRDVCISGNSPNRHILILGISGSGKSTRMYAIQKNVLEQEGEVIVLDISGDKNGFYKKETVNVISALDDGVELNFLTPLEKSGTVENYSNFLTYLVDIMSGTFCLGIRQQGALREALHYAVEHKTDNETDMEVICRGLEMQDSAVAEGVKTRLWNILYSGIFRKSEKKMQRGKINVISLKGVNPTTQRELAEIILAMLWRKVRYEGQRKERLLISIDEFQNLSLKKNATLYEMLREARGYGVDLLLATQTLAGFSTEIKAAIDQTAVQLYFRPALSDVSKIAKNIETGDGARWTMALKNLQVGESVATGSLCLQGKEIFRPLIIRTENYMGKTKGERDVLLLTAKS